MLPHPTLDKLQTLRLHGMLKALSEQLKTPDIDSLSFEERLGLLVDREPAQVGVVSVQIGRVTVGDYLNRLAACGLSWPCSLSDAELERQLFPPAPAVPSEQRPLPDWAWVHAEL